MDMHELKNPKKPSLVIAAGGNAPTAFQSGDGSWFYGFNVDAEKWRFVIIREHPDGNVREVPISVPIGGQGGLCLQYNGELWAVVNRIAGPSPIVRFRVPEWVNPRPVMTEAQRSLWRGKYSPADFDTPEETMLRVKKQLDALNDTVDQVVRKA